MAYEYPEQANTSSVEISRDEHKLIDFREKCLGEGRATLEQLGISRRIERAAKFITGEGQWPADVQQQKRYYATVVLNITRSVIERKTGMLTEARPQLELHSHSGNEDAAKILKDTIEGIWAERNVQQGLTDGLIIAQRNGSAPCLISWNPSLDYGQGDIDISFTPTEMVVFDPGIRRASELQRAEWAVIKTIRPLAEYQELYPRGHLVKPDSSMSTYDDRYAQGRPIRSPVKTQYAIWQRPGREADYIKETAIPRATEYQVYFRDRTLNPDKKFLENGAPNYLFPRLRVMVSSGETVLYDGPSKYWDGRYPLEIMDWGIEVDHPYGESEVDQYRSLQQAINQLISGVVNNARLMNNPPKKVSTDAGMLPEDIQLLERIGDQPGKVWELDNIGGIADMIPGPYTSLVLEVVQALMRAIELVSGLSEVTAGKKPAGVCVDTQTECLTKRGWKRYDELADDDWLYTFNPKTEKGEWSPLIKKTVIDWDGEVYTIESERLSACVTPNHGWLVGTLNEKENAKPKQHRKIRPTQRNWATGDKYQRVEMKDINTTHYIPSTIPLGGDEETLRYDDNFVELLGWIVTEGNYQFQKRVIGAPAWETSERQYHTWCIEISQSLKVNRENCDRIARCLTDLRIPYSLKIDKRTDVASYRFYREHAQRIMEQFPDKRPGYEFIVSLTSVQIKILYDVMRMADGHVYDPKTSGPMEIDSYFSADAELAHQFQMIAVLAGKPTHLMTEKTSVGRHKRDVYGPQNTVNCRRDQQTKWRTILQNGSMKKEHYRGIVWCPTTLTGTWLARRKGITYLTHNSSNVALETLVLAAQTIVRLQGRAVEDFLSRIGQLIVSRIIQYYTNDRLFSYFGPTNEVIKAAWQRKQFLDALKMAGSDEEVDAKLQKLHRDFKFSVVPFSSLAATRQQQMQIAMALHAIGGVNTLEVNKAARIPDPEKKLQDAQAEQMQKAQQALMLRAVAGGGGGGGGGQPSGNGAARQMGTKKVPQPNTALRGGVGVQP